MFFPVTLQKTSIKEENGLQEVHKKRRKVIWPLYL